MIHTRFTRLLKLAVVATCFLAWSSSPVLGDVVTFEWATVGNPGNTADSTGFGSVGNTYRISKHEVTNTQYTCFLNAVAATDTNGLYNINMGGNVRGGITQSGGSGSFTYLVKADMGNKPVNYVSFFDAMRFINWLDNGQPTGMQTASTTEAGVYTIGSGRDEVRRSGATFFIPSENEWYKAAYHKNDGKTDNYWEYPTSSDIAPTVATASAIGDISNPGTNVANYDDGANWNGQDGNVTTVGSATSVSPYGILDQGGNVWEWNESVAITSSRGIRGGGWSSFSSDFAASSFRFGDFPFEEKSIIGFRVASIPAFTLPQQYTVTHGQYVSGDVTDLADSDNNDLSLRRLGTDVQSRTEFEVKSVSPTETPSWFQFILEGSAFFRSPVTQTIELFDYDLAVWELVDTSPASRFVDSITTVTPTGDLSRFVEAGTMCIEARIHYQSANPRQNFASNTDQAVWTIGQ